MDSPADSRPIQEPLADRAVLQVAQAAPQDQKVLGNYRERCQNTDSGCYYCLLPCGDCPARYEVETLDLRGLANPQHIIDAQNTAQGTVR